MKRKRWSQWRRALERYSHKRKARHSIHVCALGFSFFLLSRWRRRVSLSQHDLKGSWGGNVLTRKQHTVVEDVFMLREKKKKKKNTALLMARTGIHGGLLFLSSQLEIIGRGVDFEMEMKMKNLVLRRRVAYSECRAVGRHEVETPVELQWQGKQVQCHREIRDHF